MNFNLSFVWLARFDVYISTTQNRHAALLIDNISYHGSISNLPYVFNENVFFMPKWTTSSRQLMDAGVISALKKRYSTKQYKRGLDLVDEDGTAKMYKIYLLTAIQWM